MEILVILKEKKRKLYLVPVSSSSGSVTMGALPPLEGEAPVPLDRLQYCEAAEGREEERRELVPEVSSK